MRRAGLGRILLVATLVAVTGGALASTLARGAAKEPIAGRWALGGGVLEFVQTKPGTYASKVIRKRPGVVCPRVNDRDGQIVLKKKAARVYEGTWVWFVTPTCKPAGKGRTTVTVARSGASATMVARPPKGLESETLTLTLTRPGAAVAATKLFGTTGPGFTISLRDAQGNNVTQVRPGRYTFVVDDRAGIHNFRLTGSGLNQAITTVPFVGQRTYTATLRSGRYTFLCDPHAAGGMLGSFGVG
jgi:hypothetical protein